MKLIGPDKWQKEVLESVALCGMTECTHNITDTYQNSEVSFCSLAKLRLGNIEGKLICWNYEHSKSRE